MNFDAALYVAHPRKLMKDKDGKYIVPDIYDLSGGSEFANQIDNLVVIDRPNSHIDKSDKMVNVYIRKIRKQKLVGRPGVVPMYFDIAKSRYYDEVSNHNPLEGGQNYIQDEVDEIPF